MCVDAGLGSGPLPTSATLCILAAPHLNSRRVTVDLPLPVAPTNATVLPPGTLKDA